ncbi:hypothetical protein C8J56DRAFT_925211 [Mycena floridula]|nr:hypothetical protein C8J56DRAFT_925211 [Mycena floridula]
MPVLPRRAALPQKSILNVLPNELTGEIISLCGFSSKAALCRVSKLFKLLAHRPLYQIISLDETANVISFHAALSANSEYGSWVRSLHITEFYAGRDIVTRILRSMTELRELSLSWGDAADWKELSLPELCILRLGGLSQTDIIIPAFLNRHPKISYLEVSSPSLRSSQTMRADLPNLTAFHGDLDMLGSTPKLLSVRLNLSEPGSLDALARFPSCRDVVIFVSFGQRMHDVPLQYLKSCMLIDYNYSPSELKSLLANHFSCSKQLESFCLVGAVGELDPDDRDSTIQTWLDSCPTLQEGALLEYMNDPTGRYKIVDGKPQSTTELCRAEKILKKGVLNFETDV